MTQNALDIYSFLMKNNIEFARYCHKEYKSPQEWKKIISKLNDNIKIPVIKYYYNNQNDSFSIFITLEETPDLFFSDEFNSKYSSIDDDNEQTKLLEVLSCTHEELSPLAIAFDNQKNCSVFTDKYTISEKNILCFSPCSKVSSVIMKTDEFFCNYLDKANHKIKLI